MKKKVRALTFLGKIHYGWIICVSCMLLMICTMGFCNNVFPVYLPYLEKTYLTGAQGSSLISIRCLFGILGMLLVNWFYRSLSLRGGMVVACVITAMAFFIYSMADTYWIFTLAAAVSGLGYGFGSMIPVGILMRNWFAERRGTAIGICAAGSGISMILFPPIVTKIIEIAGLTASFRMQTFLALVIGGIIFIIVRDSPGDKGILPYGEQTKRNTETMAVHAETPPKGKTPGKGIVIAVCFLIGSVAASAPGHFAAFFSTQGYPMGHVSLGISVFGLTLTLGKFFCGTQFDRMGGRNAGILFFAVAFMGCILCCFTDGITLAPMFGGLACMGIGLAPATVGIPVWASDFSWNGNYQTLLKWLQIMYTAGGMVMSVLPGVIYDHTNSYLSAYLLFALLLVLVSAGLWGAYSLKLHERL